MLPFSNLDVTLFNRIEALDPLTNKVFVEWRKRFLTGCSWNRSLQTLQVGNVQISSNDYVVLVPYSEDFVPFYEYYELLYDEQVKKWTGQEGDLLILGHIEDDMALNESPIQIKKKYKGRILTVKQFQNNALEDYPLKHYQFVGQ